MHRLIQGAIPEIEIRTDLGHFAELDKLVSVVTEERLSMRNRAIAVLARTMPGSSLKSSDSHTAVIIGRGEFSAKKRRVA